jgi:hypothetical protein
MSNENEAPDPFGLSQGQAPDPFGNSQQPAAGQVADPYAGLDQAAQEGVKVEQPPADAGFDDIFGGGGGGPQPPVSSGLEADAPERPPPAAHDHIPMPPASDPGMGGAPQQGGGYGIPGQGGALPPPKSGGAGKLITVIAIAVIVGGVGFFAISGKKPERPKPTAPDEPDLRKELAERPQNAPLCWKTNKGFEFTYKTGAGEEKAASRIQDVPSLYRASAECVPQ